MTTWKIEKFQGTEEIQARIDSLEEMGHDVMDLFEYIYADDNAEGPGRGLIIKEASAEALGVRFENNLWEDELSDLGDFMQTARSAGAAYNRG